MTLLEVCEPLLQYVCRLNRSARKGAPVEANQVRGAILAILEEMKARSSGDGAIAPQYEQVELPLLFFVDFMIKESALPFAREWKELAYERNELAGDEKFFDLLDETLADASKAAAERLTVYYACLGLGFTGWYSGQPEYLRKKMLEVSARIRDRAELDEAAKVCPEAYEHVDTSNLIQPPTRKLVGVGIALIGIIIVLFIANIYLFKRTSEQLTAALDKIVAHERYAGHADPTKEGN